MLHHASFHLGFHCQSNHLAVSSIQRVTTINLRHDCNMSCDMRFPTMWHFDTPNAVRSIALRS